MSYTKIQGESSFVRDNNTGAVININSNAIQAARARKKANKEKAEEIETMKKDIQDIKTLLSNIVEKLDG
tara:strand:- start:126 stop:335 length:210 start_codon:yes stop_codon:yes gene_type:complete